MADDVFHFHPQTAQKLHARRAHQTRKDAGTWAGIIFLILVCSVFAVLVSIEWWNNYRLEHFGRTTQGRLIAEIQIGGSDYPRWEYTVDGRTYRGGSPNYPEEKLRPWEIRNEPVTVRYVPDDPSVSKIVPSPSGEPPSETVASIFRGVVFIFGAYGTVIVAAPFLGLLVAILWIFTPPDVPAEDSIVPGKIVGRSGETDSRGGHWTRVEYTFRSPKTGQVIYGTLFKEAAELPLSDVPPVGTPVEIDYANDSGYSLL